jgi:ligand-binding sensor domain-containing protein
MHLASDRVYAIAAGADGRLWVGTGAGAVAYDGATWMPLPPESGLGGALVLAIAVEPDGRAVWFGMESVVVRLDVAARTWTQFTPDNSPLGPGGVADLMVDSDGRVWAATLGGGLGVWDGTAWRVFNVANSRIPSNTVQRVFQDAKGTLWVGFSWPTQFGGALASFDGHTWRQYAAGRAGFSGAEALAIAQDALGRIWVGTQSAGVDVYSP